MFGIDLGNKNCLIATLEGSHPRVLHDTSDSYLVPAAIAITKDGQKLIGSDAAAYLTSYPEAGVTGFQKQIGGKQSFQLNGVKLTADDCATLMFQHLASIANKKLGREIEKAVVVVPAYFHDGQRKGVVDAARKAGMKSCRLINAPSAVALAYSYQDPANRSTFMVLDLDDDNFDVSLLRVEGLGFEILAAGADNAVSLRV